MIPQEKEELLRELIEKYAKMYMKLAYKNGVPYHDVEDVVMEAFWSFYKSKYFGNLDERETRIMLACIVRNKCVDYYRKNHRAGDPADVKEQADELRLSELLPEPADPLDDIVLDEEYRYVRKCIEELKDIWREPVILYFIEERSLTEICEILGISGTVCRSRISRARKYLKEKLKKR